MPKQTPSASDYTKNVKGGAEASAAVAAATSGTFRRSGGNAVVSTPGASRGATSLVTQSAVARTSGSLPLSLRTTVPVSLPPLVPIPLRFSSLRGWYDASDAASIALSGSQVTTWRDKSGRGNHLTGIANTLTRPVYTASPTPFIVTTNAGFEGPANSDFSSQILTVFVVMRQLDNTGGPVVTFQSAEGHSGWWQYGGGANTNIWLEWSTTGWTPYPKVSTIPNINTDIVGGAQWNGVGNPIYVRWRGATQVTDTQGDTLPRERLRLGFRRTDIGHNARYYEVLYYNSALTSADIELVEGYLAWKWGLQASLVTGHLYKLIAPS